jgi:hypothetical protein
VQRIAVLAPKESTKLRHGDGQRQLKASDLTRLGSRRPLGRSGDRISGELYAKTTATGATPFFTHDHARSCAYRRGEDGIAGISYDKQRLCFTPSLWSGKDFKQALEVGKQAAFARGSENAVKADEVRV